MAVTNKPAAKPQRAKSGAGKRSASAKTKERSAEKKLFRPAPTMPMQNSGMLNIAIKAAREAARIQMMAFRDRTRLHITNKAAGDYVTEVDKECERVITETIKTAFPNHAILGEESGESGTVGAEYLWVVDPLDGTTNFIHGIDVFAVSKTEFLSAASFMMPTATSSLPPRKAKALTWTNAESAFPV